jgi:hypothetical protein
MESIYLQGVAPGSPIILSAQGSSQSIVLNGSVAVAGPAGPKGDGANASWGNITGDINAQTDLQAEFAALQGRTPRITVSSTQPVGPAVGDVWIVG